MNETQLRAFVHGYWENADHQTKKGEPVITIDGQPAQVVGYDELVDYWYERGIKDLAEMVLAKIGEKE